MTTQILDGIKEAYGKYTELPKVPYNIIKYLMANDEEIWRLIYYDYADGWDVTKHANLTNAQKAALIYTGTGLTTDFRVFLDVGSMDEAFPTSATILRVSPVTVVPKNYITGTQSIRFEVYSHATLNMLSNREPRSLSIIARLIEVLNGADIEGLGRIFFNYRASQYCRLMSINVGDPTYKGWDLIMCNNALGG